MKIKKGNNVFVLVLEPGDDIFSSITSFITKENITAGQFTGIGAISQAVIGYFNDHTISYENHTLTGGLEVVSLMGNISIFDGAPTIHAHIAVADRVGKMFGGHLMEGTVVSVTCEIIITPLDITLERKLNTTFNLNLID